MGQIKSTMEMVLARAERLCSEVDIDPAEDVIQRGMKLGAAVLSGQVVDLDEALRSLAPVDTQNFVQGLLRTFYRHIQLPREEGHPWEGALAGLQRLAQALSLSGDAQDQLSGVLNELRSILGRYLQHRQQLEKQLEEGFSMQAAQLQQSLAQQTGMKMKISPRQHPKFAEEWQRVQAQLNDQYGNALEHYKTSISSFFNQS